MPDSAAIHIQILLNGVQTTRHQKCLPYTEGGRANRALSMGYGEWEYDNISIKNQISY